MILDALGCLVLVAVAGMLSWILAPEKEKVEKNDHGQQKPDQQVR
jgi:hypothetical protein